MDSSSDSGLSSTLDKENEQSQCRDSFSEKLRLVVEDINIKRQQNSQVFANFKNFLDFQVMKTCTELQGKMFQIYENHSKEIDAKVQDISAALQRIDSLEKELHNFRTTVASFGKQ